MSKSKVEYERKIEIGQGYLSGKVGCAESVKRANNSVVSLRQWGAQYRSGGAAALLPTDKNKVYSQR